MDPSLSRGCSVGSAIPRRSSGAAGRCTRRAGRAEARRAREAARGKNEAIVRFSEYDQVSKMCSGALEGSSRQQRRLVKRGLFDMASCRIKKPRRSEIGRLYLFVQFHHYRSILSRVYSKHMELYELMSRLVSNDAATRMPRDISSMTSACVH